MLRKTVSFAMVLVFLGLLGNAYASADTMFPGKWWRLPRLAERLHLTDDQKRQLDELFWDNRRKLIDLKSRVERERLELENVFEQEPFNEAAVMERFKRLDQVRSNLAAERFRYVVEVRKIIGGAKFQELKVISQAFRRGREGGFPGRGSEMQPIKPPKPSP